MYFVKKTLAIVAICLTSLVTAQEVTAPTDPKGCDDAISALSFCANLLDSTGLHVTTYPSKQFDTALNSFVTCFCGSAKDFPPALQVTTCSALTAAAGNRTSNTTPQKVCTSGKTNFFQVWNSLGKLNWQVQLANNQSATSPFRAADGSVLSDSNSASIETGSLANNGVNESTNSTGVNATASSASITNSTKYHSGARRRGESLSFYMSAGTALIVMIGFMFA